jgi:DNA-binding NtrC family response regulator
LERLASGDFAVVVLDLALPDSRGPDTFAAVHGQAPGTPIIVLTGLGDEAIALRLVEDLLLVKVTDPHRNARLGHTNCGPPVPQKHPLVPQKHPVME